MAFPRLLSLALVLGLGAIAGSARGAAPADEAAAERLFREAKGLMTAGHVPEACSKLAEAKRLELGGGIVLALAVCHAKEGRGASALAEFREALALASEAKRADRVRLAEEEITRLERTVSTLTVVAPEGVAVRVNREPWDGARFGIAVPVDRGEYVVRAEAEGRKPWEATLQIAAEGESRKLEIPPLADVEAPPPAGGAGAEEPSAGAESPSGDGRGARRTAGLVVGGAGVLGLGTGGGFAIAAALNRHAADCGGQVCANGAGTYATAQTDATVATVAAIAGGVVLGAGALLFLTARGAPSPRRASVQLVPQISPTGASIGVAGRF